MSYRNRLSYLTTFSRHAKRVQYYAGGLVHHLRSYDACARETEHLLKALETHPERAELEARAAYYNRLAEPFDASRAPRVSELDRGRSRFYIDLNEHAKGFGSDKRLWYLYGRPAAVPREEIRGGLARHAADQAAADLDRKVLRPPDLRYRAFERT